jgi:hypothetical protein
MREWMRDILRTPVKEFPQFGAGLSLLPALPREEAAELLDARVELLNAEVDKVKDGLREAKVMRLAPLFTIESEYRLAGLETERTFAKDLAARIRKDGCGFREECIQFHEQKAQSARKSNKGHKRS